MPKLVKLNMELIVPDDIGSNKDAIVSYLNNMLNYDPEFFGMIDSENIVGVENWND